MPQRALIAKELADLLVARRPELKVIYTTGYSADVIDKKVPRQEGFDFLSKPYAPSQLLHTVRARLECAV